MHGCGGVPMRLLLVGRVTLVVFSILLWTGCGDTFRPVAIPIAPPPPDPAPFHFAIVASVNGMVCNPPPGNALCDPGASSEIDVSGDTNLGVAQVGLGPVHAALLPGNANRVFVANSLDDTVSVYAPSNATAIITISLPAGSTPVFLHTTESGTIYAANAGSGTVAAISTASNVVTNIITVGANPVALAETPDAKKLYVANQGSNSVSSINPLDKSVNPAITGASISSPVWVATRSDSVRAYALSQGNGALAVIDTFTDALIPNSISVGAGANFMLYDKRLNRLYITNPSAATLSILDASADPPNPLASLTLAAAPVTADHPCTTGVVPVSVAVLADGSRAYVASYQLDGSTICFQVSVISTQANTVGTIISLGAVSVDTVNPTGCSTARFRVSTAAAADSSRVYVGRCDAGDAAIIRTSDDTPLLNLPAPVSAFPPPQPGGQPPRQNPVFVVAGP